MTMAPIPCEKRAFLKAAAPIYNEIKNYFLFKGKKICPIFLNNIIALYVSSYSHNNSTASHILTE